MAGETSALFGTSVSGLLAAQRALSTTGHNIANADTPGFSRQRAELATRPARGTGVGFFGTGVNVETVRRQTDRFLVEQVRVNTSLERESATLRDLARGADALFGDPLASVGDAVSEFFSTVHQLSGTPTSMGTREAVLGAGRGLESRFRSLAGRLEAEQESADRRIGDLIERINTLGESIAQANTAISLALGQFGGQPPNDLLDRRDELLRQLSELVDVSTFAQDDGRINVAIGRGQTFVTGSTLTPLLETTDGFDPRRVEVGVDLGGTVADISGRMSGGELGGVLRFRDEVLADARNRLGELAIGLSFIANEQHRLGQDLDGGPGGDLFEPLETSAPRVLPHDANTGSPPPVVQVAVVDPSALAGSDYELRRSGASHTLTRLSDGTVFTLSGFPGGTEIVDGLAFTLSSGAIADGDRFRIEPLRAASEQFGLAVTDPRALAAASPVRAGLGAANTGSVRVSSLTVNSPANALRVVFGNPPTTFDLFDDTTGARVLEGASFTPGAPITVNGLTFAVSGAPAAGDAFLVTNRVGAAGSTNTGSGSIGVVTVSSPDPNLRDTLTLTFNDPPTTFDVAGSSTGSPTTGVAFSPGTPVSFNGLTFVLEGSPDPGDVVTIAANGAGVSDNRNALALQGLQTARVLDGDDATFEGHFGQTLARVGARTREADVEARTRKAVLEQAIAARSAVAGVNLDEEAASLLAFQRLFEANAQVITAADEMFQTLLRATGG